MARLGARSVGDAWRDHGEAAWRQAEATAFAACMDGVTTGVLSLGGGTPTAPGVAARIRAAQAAGQVTLALLDPGEDALIDRLRASRGDRPELGDDPADEVARLRRARMPLYRSMADAIIDTRMPPEWCVERLAALLRPAPRGASRASGSPRVRSRRGP